MGHNKGPSTPEVEDGFENIEIDDDLLADDDLDFSDIPEIEVDFLPSESEILEILKESNNYFILKTRRFVPDREETKELPHPASQLRELSESEPLSRPDTSPEVSINRAETLEGLRYETLKIPPPTPSTILLREAERRAPEVDWSKNGSRSVCGRMVTPVPFQVTVDILLMQPLCVHIELRLPYATFTADGEIQEAWDDISGQLWLIHRDVSLSSFFFNRGG